MMSRLPHAPLSEKKRKAPGMAPGVHGVLVSNKRVHLWGPRFVDIGVHHNLKTMFADMAPIQVDDSDDDCVAPPQATCHTTICVEAALAQETVDILEPLEQELQSRMRQDGQLASSIIHMSKALDVVRRMLDPAKECLSQTDPTDALRFDSSDVARVHDMVINLFCNLRRL